MSHFRAAAIFIVVVMLMSVGLVMFYHHTYSVPVYKGVMDAIKTDRVVMKNFDTSIQLLQKSNSLQNTINLLLAQNTRQADMKILDLIEGNLLIIEMLEDKVKKLERREEEKHFELLRAIAILQKDHWSEEMRNESSGFAPSGRELNIESHMKAYKEIMLPAEKQPSLEEVEREIQKW